MRMGEVVEEGEEARVRKRSREDRDYTSDN